MDDSRPGNNIPVTGLELIKAMNAVLAGRQVNAEQKPSIGCNIKWKPENEPEYVKQSGVSPILFISEIKRYKTKIEQENAIDLKSALVK
jgi:hypothetical protein